MKNQPRENRSLEDRLHLLEQRGVMELLGENRPLPPPHPLKAALTQRFLDEDRQ